MLNFTVKNLIRACQNDTKHIVLNRIAADGCAYDPEEETENIGVYNAVMDIDEKNLDAEVQDFELYDNTIRIYI